MKFFEGVNWIVVLGIIVAVEQQIGNGSMSIAHTFPAAWIPAIQEQMGNFGSIGALIMSVGAFGRVPSGSLSTMPPVVKSAIVLAVLLVGTLALSGHASAQGAVLKPLKPLLQKSATPLPAGPNISSLSPSATVSPAKPADPLSKFIADVEAVKKEIADAAIADLQAADADAAALTNPADPTSFRDPISHACYPAAVKFLQSLPSATPTVGEIVVAQVFQKKRDFVAQIQAGLPVYLKLGCSPLLGDEAAVFAKLMGLVGVQVGLNAIVPGLGIALPAL
jgi:sorbitol-specific phosphotransferase system component IIBC